MELSPEELRTLHSLLDSMDSLIETMGRIQSEVADMLVAHEAAVNA